MVSFVRTVLLIDQKWPRVMSMFPRTNQDYVWKICYSDQHVFFCEYCDTFKNTYFEEHLRTAASALSEL